MSGFITNKSLDGHALPRSRGLEQSSNSPIPRARTPRERTYTPDSNGAPVLPRTPGSPGQEPENFEQFVRDTLTGLASSLSTTARLARDPSGFDQAFRDTTRTELQGFHLRLDMLEGSQRTAQQEARKTLPNAKDQLRLLRKQDATTPGIKGSTQGLGDALESLLSQADSNDLPSSGVRLGQELLPLLSTIQDHHQANGAALHIFLTHLAKDTRADDGDQSPADNNNPSERDTAKGTPPLSMKRVPSLRPHKADT